MSKRHLQLSHIEIELIQNSLSYLYNRKLDLVAKNTKILSDQERKSILESANKYDDLRSQIENGDKDV